MLRSFQPLHNAIVSITERNFRSKMANANHIDGMDSVSKWRKRQPLCSYPWPPFSSHYHLQLYDESIRFFRRILWPIGCAFFFLLLSHPFTATVCLHIRIEWERFFEWLWLFFIILLRLPMTFDEVWIISTYRK